MPLGRMAAGVEDPRVTDAARGVWEPTRGEPGVADAAPGGLDNGTGMEAARD